MTTSGTTSFTLDVADIIEEAYELVGMEVRGGYDMRTARRSLNLLMREWGNKGINFWTIRENTIGVPGGMQDVPLPTDTIDVLDAVWRTGTGTSQTDRIITRMSVVDWSQTANKTLTGSPTRFWVRRTLEPTLTLWPAPYTDGTLVYYSLRSIEDVGGYTNTMDVPPRFLPALTTGLAYYISLKKSPEKAVILKTEYDRQFTLASEEDRERTPFRLVPDLSRY